MACHSPQGPALGLSISVLKNEQQLLLHPLSRGSSEDWLPGWARAPPLGYHCAGSCRTEREGAINQKVASCTGKSRQERQVQAEGTAQGCKQGPGRKGRPDPGPHWGEQTRQVRCQLCSAIEDISLNRILWPDLHLLPRDVRDFSKGDEGVWQG